MPRDWESYIDRAIRQAINDGKMTDNPGKGEPLRLGDDKHTPPELRMAHKILKDNDLTPDWMMQSRELDTKRDQLEERVQRTAKTYASKTAAEWEKAREVLRQAVESFNKAVLSYNLKVPPGVTHKPFFDLERELAKHLPAS